MAQTFASVRETNFARYFLRYLGNGRPTDFMLIAVVAWMRMNTGGKEGKGNNLMGLKSGGKLIYFSSLNAGAKLAAQRILAGAKLTGTAQAKSGYARILAAALKNGGTSSTGRYAAAQNLLHQVVMSSWDAKHYGGAHMASSQYGAGLVYNQGTDRLFAMFQTIGGVTNIVWTTPAPAQAAPAPKVKIPPHPPVYRVAHPILREYLVGAETRAFYETRHPGGMNVVPPGMAGTMKP